MDNTFLAGEALDTVLKKYPFQTVLDIGAGQGLHTAEFRNNLKFVLGIDAGTHWGTADIVGEFSTCSFDEPFDLIWCSHVLEHQVNVNRFLTKIFQLLKPGGILAITVPPSKPHIVGGHVSVWNAGLLIYNLVLAGFDCRHAMLKQYDYNISIIVRKSRAALPKLNMDAGDIETLAPYFPCPVHQDFNGNIEFLNWDAAPDPRPVAGRSLTASGMNISLFQSLPDCHEDDLEHLLWALCCIELPGDIVEFGVFQGNSISAMASSQPYRVFHGLDSFTGLPEDWVRSSESTYKKGHFAIHTLPNIEAPNVRLYPGYFEDTLSHFRSTLSEPLSLIHIDSDLYSSAINVLMTLNPHIVPGTVIVFDELCDWKSSGIYPQWAEGEWKALLEWMEQCDREVRILSRGPSYSASIVVSK